MSCSDIQVQILGDATDILVYVKQAQDAAAAAAQSASAADLNESATAQTKKDVEALKTQAAASATQSATSAGQAAQYMNAAEQSAQDASASAVQAATDATTSTQAAQSAATDATRAEAAATRAENAPVRLKVSRDGQLLNETTSEFDFTGAGVVIKQKVADPSSFTVEIPGHPAVSVADVTGLQSALDAKEASLGVPTSDYQVLASKRDGTRYWVSQNGASGSPLSIEKVGGVQHLVDVMQIGDGLSVSVAGRVVTLAADVTQNEIDALTQRINGLYVKTQQEFDQACAAAIAPYATRITALESGAAITAQDIVSLKGQINGMLQSIQSLQAAKIDKVESKVNPASRTITLTFKSGQQVIDTDLIDISAMFATNPPADQHAIWFGFTTAKPPTEAQIKSGTTEQDHVIIGHDITLTRTSTTPAYMYVWIPDVLGAITGFSFAHAFTAVWQSYPVTVNGAVGKVYVSDNQTASKSVLFEVQ
ncbi:MAG: hypothetical protein ACRDCE_15065 [Cetobacterium sp.]|uniref:hypothetical protein n=1 Tax=Cetobacterium sp. TaxID=2071632 RepID=UPI003EE7CFFF